MPMRRPFLTALWRDLVCFNFEVDAGLVGPLVPAGTELDLWEGRPLASLLGFRFQDTRILGVPVPFHRDFEEVNLRFYVRRTTPDGAQRRAVVFVRELVPKRAVAWLARLLYNEPYQRVPMTHRIDRALPDGRVTAVRYRWRQPSGWCVLSGRIAEPLAPLVPGSEAEFVTEHYWGYTRQRDGSSLEYQVEHPSWRVARLQDAALEGYPGALYGPHWGRILDAPPRSAFYAEGSAVTVHRGVAI